MIKRALMPILVLLLASYSLCCDSRNFPEPEYFNEDDEVEAEQVLDVRVGLSLLTSLAQGVSFENIKVKAGTCRGERCLLVSGDINNSTSDNLAIAATATGYSSNWEAVARTLSSARIAGVAEYSLPRQTGSGFEIVLNWAEDVRYIEIQAESILESQYYGPDNPGE